jgi:hypothetical protein
MVPQWFLLELMSSQMSQLCHIEVDINPPKLDFASHFSAAVTSTQQYKFHSQATIIWNWACTWNTGWVPVWQATDGVCVQRTLCISVHSYIAWRAFLLLGACTQFQKTIIIFTLSSVRIEKFVSYRMDSHDVIYGKIFGKSFGKVEILVLYVHTLYICDNIPLNCS